MSSTIFGFDLDRQWEYENGFYLTSHVTRLGKLIAHYELYKSIIHLPGYVVECGVYKGASLIRFATFRNLLESPYSRKLVGFDAFGKFPGQSDPEDDHFIMEFERAGGDGIAIDELRAILARKGLEHIELVEGDITSTVPSYLADHPELRISLLHLDVDVYIPTRIVLESLYHRVVPGGLVVLDDFSAVSGATKAIEEFVAEKNVVIEKLPIAHAPSFIRKPGP